MSTAILSEKHTLLALLSSALNDLDRAGLGKVVNLVAGLAWPSQKRQLVKSLVIAELHIDPAHEALAAECRKELEQERREAEARQKEERERAEKRAETSAKQSAAARLRHEVEAQVKAGKSALPPSTPNADPMRSARPAEPPRPSSPPPSQPPFTHRDRNPSDEN